MAIYPDCMTSKTRKIFGLFVTKPAALAASLASAVEPELERSYKPKLRKRREGKGSCTKPPRSREGLSKSRRGHAGPVECSHNVYPGGKSLRKSLDRLHKRVEGVQPGNAKRPDRINARDEGTPWDHFSLTKPGSMAR